MYHAQHGSPQELRRQFSTDRLETATNERILVLCFDRLDRDLALARTAIAAQDHYAANDTLGHAQDLLGELAAMLDVDVWDHARSLLALYDYLLRLLARANTLKSDALVAEAQHIVSEIGDSFRAAATTGSPTGDQPAALPPRSATPTDGAPNQLWVRA